KSHSPNVDLTTVQARCQRQISATAWYQHARAMGISYGPAYQGVEQLRLGADEVLARFRLPTVVAQTRTDFVLHPSVLDAALQACIALLIEQHGHHRLQLPFALDELKIVERVPTQGWAWVRRMSGS